MELTNSFLGLTSSASRFLKSSILLALIVICAACGGEPVAENQTDVEVQFETPKDITLEASNSPTSWNIESPPSNGELSGAAPDLIYTPSQGYSGADSFTFTATNDKGTSEPATISLIVLEPLQEVVINEFSASAVQINEGGSTTLNWSVAHANSVAIEPGLGSVENIGSVVVSPLATTQYTLTATNAISSSEQNITITVQPTTSIPNPEEIAPEINPQDADFDDEVSFLYEGDNPIQTNVDETKLDTTRLSVVRGKVLQKDETPLGDVSVSVANHPEFGTTKTRSDGVFDMAVNGGTTYTLEFRKAGYFAVQRYVRAESRDYRWAEKVVMIQRDPASTVVSLNNSEEMQVVTGSLVTDEEGSRRARILIPKNTTAYVENADGSQQALGSEITIRATEYTVGENGPETMPGPLPPTSGYTYAVELSVDEAPEFDASVKFSQPLFYYVDNFLGFPVGWAVPVGWYDYDKAAWIASDNGVVLQVLSVRDGQAVLDLTGSGVEASDSELQVLGFNDDELIKLAELYQPGDSLWRAPIPHFTPWDLNWPVGPPEGAEVAQDDPFTQDGIENPFFDCGSIIECENQVLGETIPLAGSDLTLNYRSNRVEGYTKGRIIEIPLTDDTVPEELVAVWLRIEVAGQLFEQSFNTDPNQHHTFIWNGLDAYGRKVYSDVAAQVSIGYEYNSTYYGSFDLAEASFGSIEGVDAATTDNDSRTVTLWNRNELYLTGFASNEMLGFGGWSLNNHHYYEPRSGTLLLGSGERREQKALREGVRTVAGSGETPENENDITDGANVLEAKLNNSKGLAVGEDGSYFIVDHTYPRVRKVAADGKVYTVAGNGSRITLDEVVDNVSATSVGLINPESVALDRQGNIYIGDDRLIRKVDTSGIITTIAGGGDNQFGEFVPALEIKMEPLLDLKVMDDGTIYFYENGIQRIRKITQDGIVNTVAGGNPLGALGDGGPAVGASIFGNDFDVAPDGNIYIADTLHSRVRRVDTVGIISTIAGTGEDTGAVVDDGLPALESKLPIPFSVTVAPNGELFVAAGNGSTIVAIRTDGIQEIVSVGLPEEFECDECAEDVLNAHFIAAVIEALDDGGVVMMDHINHKLKVLNGAERFSGQAEYLIPSTDGSLTYRFDQNGFHQETFNSLTKQTIYSFQYEGGYLTKITDAYSNETIIHRTGSILDSIEAPFNRVTDITPDQNGYIDLVTYPDDSFYDVGYKDGGLLNSFRKPNASTSTIDYDDSGSLISDASDVGNAFTITQNDLDLEPGQIHSSEVTMETALGRENIYRVNRLRNGTIERVRSMADGEVITIVRDKNDKTTRSSSDGTVVTTEVGSDPRFGLIAPYNKLTTVSLPSGKQLNVTRSKTVTLTDPSDIYSVASSQDTIGRNGKNTTIVFDRANLTYTITSPEQRVTTHVVDELGRLTEVRRPGIEPLHFVYDERGRLEETYQGEGLARRSASNTYDPNNGFLTRITYPDASWIDLSNHDLMGRPRTKNYSGVLDVSFEFDLMGDLQDIIPNAKPAHGLVNDGNGFLVDYIAPAVGDINRTTHYEYTNDLKIDWIDKPAGDRLEYTYIPQSGLLDTVTAGVDSIDYSYYENTNQVQTITNSYGINLELFYDGYLSSGETWSGTIAGEVGISFNNELIPESISVNGQGIAYLYDDDDLLVSAGDLVLNPDVVTGQLRTTTLGNTTTSTNYDDFGGVDDYTASFQQSVLYHYDVTLRDAFGRIVEATETINNTTTSYRYDYDELYRLWRVSIDGSLVREYGYDGNGNRTHLNNVLVGSYDNQDRTISYDGHSYSYNDSGELRFVTNTASSEVTEYRYDNFGNLNFVKLPNDTEISYLSDGRNRRVGKLVNGTYIQGFLYQDKLKPVAELDGNNNVISRFVYGDRLNVPSYMLKNGEAYRIISDRLGSVKLVVNIDNGSVAQRMEYDEFGNVLTDTNPGFQPFGFAGGLYDRDTNLVRFGARDYSSTTGRWTSKDPILFNGEQLNLYAYSHSDPVNFVDPSGLASLVPGTPGESSPGDFSGGTDTVDGWYPQPCMVLCNDGSLQEFPNGDTIFDDLTNDNGDFQRIDEVIRDIMDSGWDEETLETQFCY